MTRPLRALGRFLLLVLALLLVVLGLFFLPLPIPLGLPLLVLAAGLLSALSPRVRRTLERFAARHPRALGWLARFLHRVAERDPAPGDRPAAPSTQNPDARASRAHRAHHASADQE